MNYEFLSCRWTKRAWEDGLNDLKGGAKPKYVGSIRIISLTWYVNIYFIQIYIYLLHALWIPASLLLRSSNHNRFICTYIDREVSNVLHKIKRCYKVRNYNMQEKDMMHGFFLLFFFFVFLLAITADGWRCMPINLEINFMCFKWSTIKISHYFIKMK